MEDEEEFEIANYGNKELIFFVCQSFFYKIYKFLFNTKIKYIKN